MLERLMELQKDAQNFYPDNDNKREGYLQAVQDIIDDILVNGIGDEEF